MATVGRLSLVALCLGFPAFVLRIAADRPIGEVKVEPSSLVSESQSEPSLQNELPSVEPVKQDASHLNEEDISQDMQDIDKVDQLTPEDRSQDNRENVEVTDRETNQENREDVEVTDRENNQENREDVEVTDRETNQENREDVDVTDRETNQDSQSPGGKGGDLKFFKGTHALGLDLENLVHKLSTHVNKDMNNEGELALKSSKEYQSRLKNLDHGLTQFTVGVDHFRKGTAKSHHTKTALIRDTMSKGLKGGQAPAEEHPKDDNGEGGEE